MLKVEYFEHSILSNAENYGTEEASFVPKRLQTKTSHQSEVAIIGCSLEPFAGIWPPDVV